MTFIKNNSQRNSKLIKKILILCVLALAIAIYFTFDLGSAFSLDWLKSNGEALLAKVESNFWLYGGIYFLIYIVVTALSLPGAAVMTLAGGFLFGLFKGFLLVSFASSIGASLAFIVSRFLLGDWVKERFKGTITEMQKGIEKEGKLYLFSLRLVPIFPFFLINLVMGLTPMRLSSFYWVSQIGMLPGTLVYVNAGTSLAKIDSLEQILSPGIIASFALLGIFPLVANALFGAYKRKQLYRGHQRPKKFDYNAIVIGAGSGGLVASLIASTVKARVALVEKHKMGGDCLNTGCVPSKALIKASKVASAARDSSKFGVHYQKPVVDFSAVMDHVRGAIKTIEPNDSVERYSSLGVDCLQGKADLISPYEVIVNGQKISAKNIIIASGASPRVPNIEGLESIPYLTSENLWELEDLPEKLLVLGGGAIGCELSQAFARLGSKVSLLEASSRLLKVEDPEVSSFLENEMASLGVNIIKDSKPIKFENQDGVKTLHYQKDGEVLKLEFSHLLIALGRTPNTKGFGLEKLGVELTQKGAIKHNGMMQTNYPNIFVCGDVSGDLQFTHVASHQAWYAMVNALFSPFARFKADYRVIPWCTFVEPEIARVGINEQEAIAQKLNYDISLYDLKELDRAIADGENKGFIKVVTSKGKDKILGATIVGPRAADLIPQFAIAMKNGIGLNKILATVYLYPSYSESLKFLAGNWKKEAWATKSNGLLKWIQRYHAWRRG